MFFHRNGNTDMQSTSRAIKSKPRRTRPASPSRKSAMQRRKSFTRTRRKTASYPSQPISIQATSKSKRIATPPIPPLQMSLQSPSKLLLQSEAKRKRRRSASQLQPRRPIQLCQSVAQSRQRRKRKAPRRRTRKLQRRRLSPRGR